MISAPPCCSPRRKRYLPHDRSVCRPCDTRQAVRKPRKAAVSEYGKGHGLFCIAAESQILLSFDLNTEALKARGEAAQEGFIITATAADKQLGGFVFRQYIALVSVGYRPGRQLRGSSGEVLPAESVLTSPDEDVLKDDGDSITLRVAGGGPTGTVVACTDGTGNVKGCIDHPLVELPLKANGHLDVGSAVGKNGVLTVIRDNRLQKEPTVGQVPLVSGEIAEDLTSYYAYSEQVPTVCALGVLVDTDLTIACAGGFLLQLLPGATDAEITQLEQNIAAMPSVTELLREGKTPEDMMNLALAGFKPNVLDEREVQYKCDCSEERTEEMLLSLGRKELEKLRDEDPDCEVVCHFCHTKYHFDLNKLVEKAAYKKEKAETQEPEA